MRASFHPEASCSSGRAARNPLKTDASLADLYDPVAMPPDVRKAHQALNKAVDAAYAGAGFKPAPAKSDAERVAFLFELYHKYTSLLPGPEVLKRRRTKK